MNIEPTIPSHLSDDDLLDEVKRLVGCEREATATYRVTFTASTAACEKLELAKDLLRHVIPSGDPAQILERALDVLVKKLVKDEFAVTSQPRTSSGQCDRSRNIPAEVKQPVYIRDQGRCAFIGSTGRKCGVSGLTHFRSGTKNPAVRAGRAT